MFQKGLIRLVKISSFRMGIKFYNFLLDLPLEILYIYTLFKFTVRKNGKNHKKTAANR